MGGDACWSAGDVSKYNILADDISLIKKVSIGCSGDGPEYLGIIGNQLYFASHKWAADDSNMTYLDLMTYDLNSKKMTTILDKKDFPKDITNMTFIPEEKSIFMGSNIDVYSSADDKSYLYNIETKELTQQVPQSKIIPDISERLRKKAKDQYNALLTSTKNYLIIEEQPMQLNTLQSVTSQLAYNDYGQIIEGTTQSGDTVQIMWADELKKFQNMPSHDQDPNGYYIFKLGYDTPYLSQDKQYIYFSFMFQPDLKAPNQTFSGFGKGIIDTGTGKVYIKDETDNKTETETPANY
ncbi:MAG: hypothetical protein E6Q58_02450 [Niabella sp.]|nr:MAG: hypothetical protein E6Q58_02450 [Niabella sp.]